MVSVIEETNPSKAFPSCLVSEQEILKGDHFPIRWTIVLKIYLSFDREVVTPALLPPRVVRVRGPH